MTSFSIGDVVLVRYPFSDSSISKIRPAVVISAPHVSHDIFLLPLTSRTGSLLSGEFVLVDWSAAGLHIASAAKRGIYTVHRDLVIKTVGKLSTADLDLLRKSIRQWLGL